MSTVKLALRDTALNHTTIQPLIGVEPSLFDRNDIAAALAAVTTHPQYEPGRHVALICIPGGKS